MFNDNIEYVIVLSMMIHPQETLIQKGMSGVDNKTISLYLFENISEYTVVFYIAQF